MADKSQLQTSRVIAIAILSGALMFWGVAWVLSQGASEPRAEPPAPEQTILFIWAAVALTTFGAALYMQRQAAALSEDARARGASVDAVAVQSRLTAAWALLEMPALFAGVALLVWGMQTLVLVGAPLLLIGFAITFPRAEWFE